jgi:hypothetical protein
LTLTKAEKESWVIELHNQGKTIREIAQLVHMSFGDISSITRRCTGEEEDQNRIRMSKASQALKMFEQGNNPVLVAITLDIETGEVDRLYREYWKLKGLYDLRQVYAEIKGSISSFVKLYQLTKKEGMEPQHVVNALKISEKLPRLEPEYDYVRGSVFALKSQQGKLEHDLYELNKYKECSAGELESLRKGIDKVIYDKQQLSSLIERLKTTEEYLDLNTIVERKVLEILDNKRFVIGIALSALLIAIRNDPDNELLNDLVNEEIEITTNPKNEYYRQKLVEVAQRYYTKLGTDCVNIILNSISFESGGE